MINEKITQIVNKSGFNKGDILVYLLSLYFNLEPTYINEQVKEETNRLGIINRDYKNGVVHWVIPLFDKMTDAQIIDTEDNWLWVQDYRKLFINLRKDGGGDKPGTIKKMRKFFSENPEVRKDDIMNAANMYLLDFASGKNDPHFMQRADYFISKQVHNIGGSSIESRLLQYLEIVKTDTTDSIGVNKSKMRGLA